MTVKKQPSPTSAVKALHLQMIAEIKTHVEAEENGGNGLKYWASYGALLMVLDIIERTDLASVEESFLRAIAEAP